MDHYTQSCSTAHVALNDRQLDRIFRALTDSTRRWMIAALLEGEASVGQLAEPHPQTLPSLMKHLRVLEKYGLIRTRKQGRTRMCSVEPEALYAAERWLRNVMWARYRARLGSVPEDYPQLRAAVRGRS